MKTLIEIIDTTNEPNILQYMTIPNKLTKMAKVQISATIDKDLSARITQLAKLEKRSFSQMIEMLAEKGLTQTAKHYDHVR